MAAIFCVRLIGGNAARWLMTGGCCLLGRVMSLSLLKTQQTALFKPKPLLQSSVVRVPMQIKVYDPVLVVQQANYRCEPTKSIPLSHKTPFL